MDLASHVDYIRFVYGLGYVGTAMACALIRPCPDLPLRWRWLGLFGLLHGLNEWIDLVPEGGAWHRGLVWAQALLWVASFVCLAEFGRTAFRKGRDGALGYAVPAALGLAGLQAGGAHGLKAALTFALALPACALASAATLRAWHRRGGRDRGLWLLGVSLALYGAFSGLVGPAAPFFPASVWNREVFARVVGTPVWAVRALAAAGVALGVWGHARAAASRGAHGVGAPLPRWVPLALLAVLAAGWAVTDGLAGYARGRLQAHARALAVSLAQRTEAVQGELRAAAADLARSPAALRALAGPREPARPSSALAPSGAPRSWTLLVLDADGRVAARTPALSPPLALPPTPMPEQAGWCLAPGPPGAPAVCARHPVSGSRGGVAGFALACAPALPPGLGTSDVRLAVLEPRSPEGAIPAGWITAQGAVGRRGWRAAAAVAPDAVSHYRLFGMGLTLLGCVLLYALYVLPRRRRVEALALAASERRLRQVLERSPDAIVVFDRADGSVRWVNPAVERLLGVSAGAARGMPVASLLDDAGAAQALSRAVEAGRGAAGVWRCGRGPDLYLEGTGAELTYEGRPCVLVSLRDVTDRVRAEEALERNRQLLRTVLEHTDNALLALDPDHRVVFHNPQYSRMWGVDPALLGSRPHITELVGWACRNGVYPPGQEQEIVARRMADLESAGAPTPLEMPRLDGRIVEGIAARLPDGGHLLAFRDVTDRERMVEALRESEQRYRSMMEAMEDPVYICSDDHRVTYMNPAMARRLGRDATGEPCHRAVHGLPSPCPWCPMAAVATQRAPRRVEVESPADGRAFNAVSTPLSHADGRVSVLTILHDVTERRAMEAALRAQKEFADRLILNSPVAAFVIGPDRRVLLWNRACEELTGWPAERIVGSAEAWRPFYGEPRPTLADLVLEGRTGEVGRYYESWSPSPLAPEGLHAERWYRNLNGRERYVVFDAVPIRDQGGRLIAVLETIQDISSQKRSEERLSLLGTAVHQAAEAILVTDPAGRIEYANPAFERITGYRAAEVLGRSVSVLKSGRHDASFYRDMWRTIASGQVWTGRLTNRRKDGSLYEEEASISPVLDESGRIRHYVAVKRDVSREAELERQLRQAQKLEALGTLAGGIAHDFNNILTAMVGYAEMTLDDVEPGSTAESNLHRVLAGGERAKRLIGQILTFSSESETERQAVDIGSVVVEAVTLLRAGLPPAVTVRFRDEAGEGRVLADPTQIHQVVMNLGTNAAHALGPEGGQIEITLSVTEVDPDLASRHPGLRPGPHLRLAVSDTGRGIDPQVISRIFDPFFTTKQVGEGTGLGLSVVHGIVRAHAGAVIVHSTPGEGSTFHVLLPLLDPGSRVGAGGAPAGGDERLLVVDDMGEVAQVQRQVLESLGYRVCSLTDPGEALRELRSDPHGYDLLLTDQSMPGMPGTELARRARRVRPDLPVVLCTGFEREATRDEAARVGIAEVVLKPVTVRALGDAVRRALERGAASHRHETPRTEESTR